MSARHAFVRLFVFTIAISLCATAHARKSRKRAAPLRVINLFAGPGAGKSTAAAGLFHQMKAAGMNVELVTEFAKDLVWERRFDALTNQVFVIAEQHHRMARLRGQVDWIVTDSPLLLGMHYRSRQTPRELDLLIGKLMRQFTNINFFVERGSGYQNSGRRQTAQQAKRVDRALLRLMRREGVKATHVAADNHAPERILSAVLKRYTVDGRRRR